VTTSSRPDPLSPGLYFVATPIGCARDITLRALDILAAADVIAAEDTRTARKLMGIHGVAMGSRPLIAYHDHSGAGPRGKLLDLLAQGKSVAYVSEAGTPLVSDPGFHLGRAAREKGFSVFAAPGASAVLAALMVSGLPTDRFFFAGFLPVRQSARARAVARLKSVPGTLVFFESPKRVGKMLGELVHGLGGEREAAICRELTKRFEEVLRGTLAELAQRIGAMALRGEVVIVVERAQRQEASMEMLENALRQARKTMTLKEAVRSVSRDLDMPRRTVYQLALGLEDEG